MQAWHSARNGDVKEPWALVLFGECRLFGSLPYTGGVLDQDARLMEMMKSCHSASVLSRGFDIKDPAHRDFYRWLFPKED